MTDPELQRLAQEPADAPERALWVAQVRRDLAAGHPGTRMGCRGPEGEARRAGIRIGYRWLMSDTRFFGEAWPSGICDIGRQVPTPVGEACLWCGVEIDEVAQGSFVNGDVPIRKECSLRSVMGGIGHLSDHAYWCVERGDPDGGRSARDSAIEAWQWLQAHEAPRPG